jgi:hypothetical protein
VERAVGEEIKNLKFSIEDDKLFVVSEKLKKRQRGDDSS